MPLHRDIYWLGRQWAVTGYGMQAVNQKRHGSFDVEASRLWDDAVLERLRTEDWFNAEDFNKGLTIARARHPQPLRQAEPPRDSVPPPEQGAHAPPKAEVTPGPPAQAAAKFDWRVGSWPAKFTSLWRVRAKG
ncbi:hypothetical protein [Bradyrhizobium sp. dw_78]|uniref:hypothetical protein n=1 Tax=Bradyrhizobium sp. dw_78 TaxID=2719793 RepID=UPI001BD5603B|nr:hypothetical protein [Bradyrhizobium sp. dw_78]